jgi:hypothetical protein
MNNISVNNLIQALGLSLIAAGIVTILNSFWSGALAIVLGLYLISRMNKLVQDVAIDFLEGVKTRHPERVNIIGKLEWFYIKIMRWGIGAAEKEDKNVSDVNKYGESR